MVYYYNNSGQLYFVNKLTESFVWNFKIICFQVGLLLCFVLFMFLKGQPIHTIGQMVKIYSLYVGDIVFSISLGAGLVKTPF